RPTGDVEARPQVIAPEPGRRGTGELGIQITNSDAHPGLRAALRDRESDPASPTGDGNDTSDQRAGLVHLRAQFLRSLRMAPVTLARVWAKWPDKSAARPTPRVIRHVPSHRPVPGRWLGGRRRGCARAEIA